MPAALGGWGVVLAGLYLGWVAAVALGATALVAVVLAVGGVSMASALVVGVHAWQLEHHGRALTTS